MRIAAIEAPDRATGRLTENGNRIGDVTVSGTIELIVFVGLFSGLFGAAAYLISEPWLTWAGRLRGVAFGVLLLAAASGVALNPDNIDFVLVSNQRLVVAMFSGMFVLYGVLLVALSGLLELLIPRVSSGSRGIATFAPVVGVGTRQTLATLFGMVALVVLLSVFYEGVCDCRPRYVTELFTLGTAAATVGIWISIHELQIAPGGSVGSR